MKTAYKKWRIEEFNPFDGYFALVSDPKGRLVCKVFSRDDAICIIDAMSGKQAEPAIAKAKGTTNA